MATPPPTEPEVESRAAAGSNAGTGPRRRRPPSLLIRLLLLAAGWVVLLVGVAGLALPGIQGILTILVGAAILSVASETVYRLLRRLLHRWPGVWQRLESFREWLRDKLSRHP